MKNTFNCEVPISETGLRPSWN